MKDCTIECGGKTYRLEKQGTNWLVQSDDKKFTISPAQLKSSNLWIEKAGDRRIVTWPGGNLELQVVPWQAGAGGGEGSLKPMKLTMPGKILAVNVKEGDTVKKGDCIAVVEAMKMENNLLASAEAFIDQVFVKTGDRLDAGAQIVSFKPIE